MPRSAEPSGEKLRQKLLRIELLTHQCRIPVEAEGPLRTHYFPSVGAELKEGFPYRDRINTKLLEE